MRLTVNKITQISIPLVFGGIGAVFGLARCSGPTRHSLLAAESFRWKDLRAAAVKKRPGIQRFTRARYSR